MVQLLLEFLRNQINFVAGVRNEKKRNNSVTVPKDGLPEDKGKDD